LGKLDAWTALVTGASSGIGEGLAKMLAAEGARVALVARREAELERVAQAIRSRGGTAIVVPADLSEEKALQAALVETRQSLGPVDILVNCAGILTSSPVHEMDLRAWDATMQINLRTPTLLCAAVLPAMRERRRGFIVNVASEAGAFVFGGMGAYAVSKHGLRVLTELVQRENQEFGIKAWAICPGWVDTPMAGSSSGTNSRHFLKVEEVADVVRYLMTQGDNVKMGPEILIRTTRNPYSRS
jgi:NAD(P)-dependent dehydrogenase (short-subunit alcohol dehydrogenase family)